MKKTSKIIALLLCFLLAFSAAACGKTPEKNGPDDSILPSQPVQPVEVPANPIEKPQPLPIDAGDAIGEWPARETLPPGDSGRAPYIFSCGAKNDAYELTETVDSSGGVNAVTALNVKYPAEGVVLKSWDYFWVDVANWQSSYQFLTFKFNGIKSGSAVNAEKITVAAFYDEMYDNGGPLVPLLVETFFDNEAAFYVNLGSFKTIDEKLELTENLLTDQTIVRLFFFAETNPAQLSSLTEGRFNIAAINFTLEHPQKAVISGTTIQSASVYTVTQNTPAAGDTKIVRNTTSGVSNQYIEFPVGDYEFKGTEFTELEINLSYAYTRSITVAVVFDRGANSGWRNYVLLGTLSVTGAANYISSPNATEKFNLAGAQIKDTSGNASRPSDGAAVEGAFAGSYKITAIRFYIDAGQYTYMPGVATGEHNTLSTNNDRHVTIRSIEFKEAVYGPRITRGWYTEPVTINHFAIQTDSIQMGGIGKLDIKFKGGWNWFAMPVTDWTREYNVITIQFSPNGATPFLHLGVALDVGSDTVIHGAAMYYNYEDTELVSDPDYDKRTTRSISYDRATDVYTLVCDLSGKEFDSNPNFKINRLLFYVNNPEADDPQPTPFVLEFKGITFSKSV